MSVSLIIPEFTSFFISSSLNLLFDKSSNNSCSFGVKVLVLVSLSTCVSKFSIDPYCHHLRCRQPCSIENVNINATMINSIAITVERFIIIS